MDPLSPHGPFSVLAYPYQELIPLDEPQGLVHETAAPPGSAMVWDLSKRCRRRDIPAVAARTPGMALILILPPAERITPKTPLLEISELCRPSAILPFHPRLDPEDLTDLLRAGPDDLPLAVTDFIRFRGLAVDRDTRHLIRRTVELSREIRTVEGLSRALYLSRRALGRRFVSRRLPVPSHWLQISRLLRAAIQLQRQRHTLDAVAVGLGYPDGFSLSNQMTRLTGVRPSVARERLGWEWLMEAWLRMEQREGSLELPTGTRLGPTGKRAQRTQPVSTGPGRPGRGALRWRGTTPPLGRSRR
jgi:AraC-like DNA-binding protein